MFDLSFCCVKLWTMYQIKQGSSHHLRSLCLAALVQTLKFRRWFLTWSPLEVSRSKQNTTCKRFGIMGAVVLLWLLKTRHCRWKSTWLRQRCSRLRQCSIHVLFSRAWWLPSSLADSLPDVVATGDRMTSSKLVDFSECLSWTLLKAFGIM